MKRLVDTEEAARSLGVTRRAIQKWFEAGKIEGEFVNSGKGFGKGGLILKVYIDDASSELGVQSPPSPQPSPTGGEGVLKDRNKVHPGEPGCRVVTPMKNGEPIWISASAGMTNQNQAALPPLPSALEPLIQGSTPACAEGSAGKSGGGALSLQIAEPKKSSENLPQPLFSKEGSNLEIFSKEGSISPNPKALRVANLRFALIQKFNEELTRKDPNLPLFKNGNGHRSKTQVIRKYLDLYNSGAWLPDIRSELESISRSTLYNWLQLYDQGGIDGLIPAYNGNAISRVTTAEKQFLRQFLLNQNKPKIADAIRKCKFILGDQSSSSPATLRRYVNEFKAEYYDVWTLDREGKKAWNDKCASYATRAWWTLKVGEILVADGHKLNFQIINPHTGKPSRAVLVMFWDWYSSYPVGWEVMLTENVQCVATALRNAIIALGKTPDCVYLDNGKAFKAKCFTKKIVLEETEIPGMFARLGIDTMFAMKYNAQAKPIERIFGVLEWLEREVDSFTGSSINDKPANLRPNEDRAKRLRGDFTPQLDQVNDLIRQWRDFYAVQPLRGRKNQTAQELFDPGRGPGVDPKALCFLMMKAEVKRVFRERLTFDGFDWTGDCLYGLNSRVLVRYSLSDRGQIYVFSLQEKLLGVVTPVSASAPRDHEAARRTISERNQALRQTKALSALAKKASPETIDLLTRKNPELIEYIQREETKKESPKFSPFLTPQAESPIDKPEVCATDPNARPFFDYDHEKYEWLQAHPDQVTNLDREWIEDFFSRNSLYRNAARG